MNITVPATIIGNLNCERKSPLINAPWIIRTGPTTTKINVKTLKLSLVSLSISAAKVSHLSPSRDPNIYPRSSKSSTMFRNIQFRIVPHRFIETGKA